jgi:predicted transcriptional regulator
MFLKKNRCSGKFYTIEEISKKINGTYFTTYRKLNKLYTYNFIEVQVKSYFPVKRGFRLKNG